MAEDYLLEIYLRDVSVFPVLDREEEVTLARAVQAGDGTARQHLIQSNLRLVVSVARGFEHQGLPLLDLVEEGNLGLMRAVACFRPAFQCRFATYAVYWIKQAICKALTEKVRHIRIPAYMVDLVNRWRTFQDHHPYITDHEAIACALGVSERSVALVQRLARSSHLAVDEGRGGMPADRMVDEDAQAPEQRLDVLDHERLLHNRLERLPERDAEILRYRFGLDDYPRLSLEQVGQIFAITRMRVSQIERTSLDRLRRMMSSECVP